MQRLASETAIRVARSHRQLSPAHRNTLAFSSSFQVETSNKLFDFATFMWEPFYLRSNFDLKFRNFGQAEDSPGSPPFYDGISTVG